jgi:Uncharacterized protein conserved in bacteria
MKIVPYLTFNGDCSEAIKFYMEVFCGEQLKIQTYGDEKEYLSKEHVKLTPHWKDKIMHASFTMPDGNKLMLCDRLEDAAYHQGNTCALALEFATPEDMDKIFHALSKDGHVDVAIQKNSGMLCMPKSPINSKKMAAELPDCIH